jgi:hypothetical protein
VTNSRLSPYATIITTGDLTDLHQEAIIIRRKDHTRRSGIRHHQKEGHPADQFSDYHQEEDTRPIRRP